MEAADLRLIAAVRAEVSIPLAVKVSPYYTAFANFAAAAVAAGADGLVLFNRFYQPDLDLESREVVPRLELSQPSELRLPVRWIAILRPQLGAAVSLAATSGVQAGDRRGQGAHGRCRRRDDDLGPPPRMDPGMSPLSRRDFGAWMDEHEYTSVEQLRGSASAATVGDPSAFERANYMRTLRSWTAPADLVPGASR